jgi:hypothetical protein
MIARLTLLIALMGCAGVARAVPLTFQYLGSITQVPIDDLYGDIPDGSPVQFSYTFDSAALDQIPDGSSASYVSSGMPFMMTLTLPGHIFSADSVQIGVFNSLVDQYTVYATGAGGNLTIELFLQDNSGTLFANDNLPLTAPSLAAFTIKDFHFREVDADGRETQFDGQLSGIAEVPEPCTWVVLLSGIGVLIARKHGVRTQLNHRR